MHFYSYLKHIALRLGCGEFEFGLNLKKAGQGSIPDLLLLTSKGVSTPFSLIPYPNSTTTSCRPPSPAGGIILPSIALPSTVTLFTPLDIWFGFLI